MQNWHVALSTHVSDENEAGVRKCAKSVILEDNIFIRLNHLKTCQI